MKQQNQIIIIVICLILAAIGLTFQVKESRSPNKPSFVQEMKALWDKP